MRTFLLAAVATVSILLGSPGQAAQPRAVVDRVADQIAANFYDPARGAQIAAELKAEAARGAYDRHTAPLDLAEALTARLRPLDGHFQVQWQAPQGVSASPGGPQRVLEDPDRDRRANYGFRAVEVLPGNIGLIDLRYFAGFRAEDAPARARADAAMAMIAGADAVIVDLRDNGGGSPAMVGYLASYFVPRGADIYNTFKSRGPDAHETPPYEVRGPRVLDRPLYILTSARTGSAAESFAYTLQAAKRAVVVGEASGGAANPGDFAPAGDGFRVFVATGRPVNPITRTNWEGTGVTPDVVVPAGDASARARALALGEIRKAASGVGAVEAQWAAEALSPAAVDPAALAAYAGDYGSRRVAVEDGRLVVRTGRRPPLLLVPLAGDLFFVDGAATPLRMRFERDGAGRVTGLLLLTPEGRTSRWARAG
ncbi:S41 family peptidase [Phenylobacterium sp.]|uniref:S41 family peptidase n=1 Tax=Phenylobacterium sp. TaxID=1871053 RepID=UPI002FE0D16E